MRTVVVYMASYTVTSSVRVSSWGNALSKGLLRYTSAGTRRTVRGAVFRSKADRRRPVRVTSRVRHGEVRERRNHGVNLDSGDDVRALVE